MSVFDATHHDHIGFQEDDFTDQPEYPEEFNLEHLHQKSVSDEVFIRAQNHVHAMRQELHQMREVHTEDEAEMIQRFQNHLIDLITDLNDIDPALLKLYQGRVDSFSEHLKKKYGEEVFRYKMFHVLAGSTSETTQDLVDFKDEDSIELFAYDPFNPQYDFEDEQEYKDGDEMMIERAFY